MEFENVKLGMVLVANEDSNEAYRWTSKKRGAIVKVTAVFPEDETFAVTIVGADNPVLVGMKAVVEADFFEKAPADIAKKYADVDAESLTEPAPEDLRPLAIEELPIELRMLGEALGAF